MTDRNNSSRRIAAIVVLLGTLALNPAWRPATVLEAATQRQITDFLVSQGTFCFDNGAGGCFLFVPPDPNFLGWTNDLDSPVIRFAGVDYAGLADAYAAGHAPEITGSVTERPLAGGHAEVTVLLHTKNANVWVIQLDLNGDVLAQIASKPTLFGHRPADVRAGLKAAIGDTFLKAVFINSAPGAPLPDLLQINGTPDLKFLSFSTHAQGPLTAQFGVPEGTPGRCMIVQTGLFSTQGKGLALQDSFPVEDINLMRAPR